MALEPFDDSEVYPEIDFDLLQDEVDSLYGEQDPYPEELLNKNREVEDPERDLIKVPTMGYEEAAVEAARQGRFTAPELFRKQFIDNPGQNVPFLGNTLLFSHAEQDKKAAEEAFSRISDPAQTYENRQDYYEDQNRVAHYVNSTKVDAFREQLLREDKTLGGFGAKTAQILLGQMKFIGEIYLTRGVARRTRAKAAQRLLGLSDDVVEKAGRDRVTKALLKSNRFSASDIPAALKQPANIKNIQLASDAFVIKEAKKQLTSRVVSGLAGEVGRLPIMQAEVLTETMRRVKPVLYADAEGEVHLEEQQKNFLSELAKVEARTFGEFASERSGAFLGKTVLKPFKKLLRKGAGYVGGRVLMESAEKMATKSKTLDGAITAIRQGSPRLKAALGRASAFLEYLEDRFKISSPGEEFGEEWVNAIYQSALNLDDDGRTPWATRMVDSIFYPADLERTATQLAAFSAIPGAVGLAGTVAGVENPRVRKQNEKIFRDLINNKKTIMTGEQLKAFTQAAVDVGKNEDTRREWEKTYFGSKLSRMIHLDERPMPGTLSYMFGGNLKKIYEEGRNSIKADRLPAAQQEKLRDEAGSEAIKDAIAQHLMITLVGSQEEVDALQEAMDVGDLVRDPVRFTHRGGRIEPTFVGDAATVEKLLGGEGMKSPLAKYVTQKFDRKASIPKGVTKLFTLSSDFMQNKAARRRLGEVLNIPDEARTETVDAIRAAVDVQGVKAVHLMPAVRRDASGKVADDADMEFIRAFSTNKGAELFLSLDADARDVFEDTVEALAKGKAREVREANKVVSSSLRRSRVLAEAQGLNLDMLDMVSEELTSGDSRAFEVFSKMSARHFGSLVKNPGRETQNRLFESVYNTLALLDTGFLPAFDTALTGVLGSKNVQILREAGVKDYQLFDGKQTLLGNRMKPTTTAKARQVKKRLEKSEAKREALRKKRFNPKDLAAYNEALKYWASTVKDSDMSVKEITAVLRNPDRRKASIKRLKQSGFLDWMVRSFLFKSSEDIMRFLNRGKRYQLKKRKQADQQARDAGQSSEAPEVKEPPSMDEGPPLSREASQNLQKRAKAQRTSKNPITGKTVSKKKETVKQEETPPQHFPPEEDIPPDLSREATQKFKAQVEAQRKPQKKKKPKPKPKSSLTGEIVKKKERTEQTPTYSLKPKENLPNHIKKKETAKMRDINYLIADAGTENSSTAGYMVQAASNKILITGDFLDFVTYRPGDVVAVSTEGNRSNRLSPVGIAGGLNGVYSRIHGALDAGAVVRTDNLDHLERSEFNVGEREIREALIEAGYHETDVGLYSEWRKQEASVSEKSKSSLTGKEVEKKSSPVKTAPNTVKKPKPAPKRVKKDIITEDKPNIIWDEQLGSWVRKTGSTYEPITSEEAAVSKQTKKKSDIEGLVVSIAEAEKKTPSSLNTFTKASDVSPEAEDSFSDEEIPADVVEFLESTESSARPETFSALLAQRAKDAALGIHDAAMREKGRMKTLVASLDIGDTEADLRLLRTAVEGNEQIHDAIESKAAFRKYMKQEARSEAEQAVKTRLLSTPDEQKNMENLLNILVHVDGTYIPYVMQANITMKAGEAIVQNVTNVDAASSTDRLERVIRRRIQTLFGSQENYTGFVKPLIAAFKKDKSKPASLLINALTGLDLDVLHRLEQHEPNNKKRALAARAQATRRAKTIPTYSKNQSGIDKKFIDSFSYALIHHIEAKERAFLKRHRKVKKGARKDRRLTNADLANIRDTLINDIILTSGNASRGRSSLHGSVKAAHANLRRFIFGEENPMYYNSPENKRIYNVKEKTPLVDSIEAWQKEDPSVKHMVLAGGWLGGSKRDGSRRTGAASDDGSMTAEDIFKVQQWLYDNPEASGLGPDQFWAWTGQFADKTGLHFVAMPRFSPSKRKKKELQKRYADYYAKYLKAFDNDREKLSEFLIDPDTLEKNYEKNSMLWNYALIKPAIDLKIHGTYDQYTKQGFLGGLSKRAGTHLTGGPTANLNVLKKYPEYIDADGNFNYIVIDDLMLMASDSEGNYVEGQLYESTDGAGFLDSGFSSVWSSGLGSVVTRSDKYPTLQTAKAILNNVNDGDRALNKFNFITLTRDMVASNPDSAYDAIEALVKKHNKKIDDYNKKHPGKAKQKIGAVFMSSAAKVGDKSKIISLFENDGKTAKTKRVGNISKNVIQGNIKDLRWILDARHDTRPVPAFEVAQKIPDLTEFLDALVHNQKAQLYRMQEAFKILASNGFNYSEILKNFSGNTAVANIIKGVEVLDSTTESVIIPQLIAEVDKRVRNTVLQAHPIEIPIAANRERLATSQIIHDVKIKNAQGEVEKQDVTRLSRVNLNSPQKRYRYTEDSPEFSSHADAIRYMKDNWPQYLDMVVANDVLFDDTGALLSDTKHRKLWTFKSWELEKTPEGQYLIPGEIVFYHRVPGDNPHSHSIARLNRRIAGGGNFIQTPMEEQLASGSDFDVDTRYVEFAFKVKRKKQWIPATVKQDDEGNFLSPEGAVNSTLLQWAAAAENPENFERTKAGPDLEAHGYLDDSGKPYGTVGRYKKLEQSTVPPGNTLEGNLFARETNLMWPEGLARVAVGSHGISGGLSHGLYLTQRLEHSFQDPSSSDKKLKKLSLDVTYDNLPKREGVLATLREAFGNWINLFADHSKLLRISALGVDENTVNLASVLLITKAGIRTKKDVQNYVDTIADYLHTPLLMAYKERMKAVNNVSLKAPDQFQIIKDLRKTKKYSSKDLDFLGTLLTLSQEFFAMSLMFRGRISSRGTASPSEAFEKFKKSFEKIQDENQREALESERKAVRANPALRKGGSHLRLAHLEGSISTRLLEQRLGFLQDSVFNDKHSLRYTPSGSYLHSLLQKKYKSGSLPGRLSRAFETKLTQIATAHALTEGLAVEKRPKSLEDLKQMFLSPETGIMAMRRKNPNNEFLNALEVRKNKIVVIDTYQHAALAPEKMSKIYDSFDSLDPALQHYFALYAVMQFGVSNSMGRGNFWKITQSPKFSVRRNKLLKAEELRWQDPNYFKDTSRFPKKGASLVQRTGFDLGDEHRYTNTLPPSYDISRAFENYEGVYKPETPAPVSKPVKQPTVTSEAPPDTLSSFFTAAKKSQMLKYLAKAAPKNSEKEHQSILETFLSGINNENVSETTKLQLFDDLTVGYGKSKPARAFFKDLKDTYVKRFSEKARVLQEAERMGLEDLPTDEELTEDVDNKVDLPGEYTTSMITWGELRRYRHPSFNRDKAAQQLLLDENRRMRVALVRAANERERIKNDVRDALLDKSSPLRTKMGRLSKKAQEQGERLFEGSKVPVTLNRLQDLVLNALGASLEIKQLSDYVDPESNERVEVIHEVKVFNRVIRLATKPGRKDTETPNFGVRWDDAETGNTIGGEGGLEVSDVAALISSEDFQRIENYVKEETERMRVVANKLVSDMYEEQVETATRTRREWIQKFEGYLMHWYKDDPKIYRRRYIDIRRDVTKYLMRKRGVAPEQREAFKKKQKARIKQLTDTQYEKEKRQYKKYLEAKENDRLTPQHKEESERAQGRKFHTYYEAALAEGLVPQTMNAADILLKWQTSVAESVRNKRYFTEASLSTDVLGHMVFIPTSSDPQRTSEEKQEMTAADASQMKDVAITHKYAYMVLDKLIRYAQILDPQFRYDVDGVKSPWAQISDVISKFPGKSTGEENLRAQGFDFVETPGMSLKGVWVKAGTPKALLKHITNRSLDERLGEHRFIAASLRGLLLFGHFAKTLAIAVSAFHHVALYESYLASYGLGYRRHPWNPKNIYHTIRKYKNLKGQILNTAADLHKNPELLAPWTSLGLDSTTAASDIDIDSVNKAITAVVNVAGKTAATRYLVGAPLKGIQKVKKHADDFLWYKMYPAIKFSVAEHIWAEVQHDAAYAHVSQKQLREDIAAHVNNAFGGQEWERHVWANPAVRQILQLIMFAPDWTISALKTAGLPQLLGDITGTPNPLTAPTNTTLAKDQLLRKYWPAFFTLILLGIPTAVQAAIYSAFGDPDKDDERWIWNNEKDRTLYVDITPIIRKLNKQYGSTNHRRVYLRWGKQAFEVGGWITEGWPTFMGKTSIPVKALLEQLFGINSANWTMPWREHDVLGLFSVEGKFLDSRAYAFLSKFIPMSIQSMLVDRPTSFFAPVKLGHSSHEAVVALTKIIYSYADREVSNNIQKRGRVKNAYGLMVGRILDAVESNGYSRKQTFKAAESKARGRLYMDAFAELNRKNGPRDKRLSEILEKLQRVDTNGDMFKKRMESAFRRANYPITHAQRRRMAKDWRRETKKARTRRKLLLNPKTKDKRKKSSLSGR